MGQKINPNSLRLGIIRNWNSCWYSKNDYAGLLRQDYNLRKFLNERLGQAGVSKISVERLAKKVVVTTRRDLVSLSERKVMVLRNCVQIW